MDVEAVSSFTFSQPPPPLHRVSTHHTHPLSSPACFTHHAPLVALAIAIASPCQALEEKKRREEEKRIRRYANPIFFLLTYKWAHNFFFIF